MRHVTQAEIHDLLSRLPAAKLPVAYNMLERLIADDIVLLPAQQDFLRLPHAESRRLLREQARQMVEHYEQTAAERTSWQAGQFADD
jgi:hypothetical protein